MTEPFEVEPSSPIPLSRSSKMACYHVTFSVNRGGHTDALLATVAEHDGPVTPYTVRDVFTPQCKTDWENSCRDADVVVIGWGRFDSEG